jgi:hypothetical protein
MRKTFFTKTNLQLLAMSFVGLVVMLVMSLYVGASLKERVREPASSQTVDSPSATR